jgi:primary-amine oxidase
LQRTLLKCPKCFIASFRRHIVRPEDFPVMPVETTGFMLKPFGFFSQNPGLDIPPGRNTASQLHGAANGSSGGGGGAPATPRTNGCCAGQV